MVMVMVMVMVAMRPQKEKWAMKSCSPVKIAACNVAYWRIFSMCIILVQRRRDARDLLHYDSSSQCGADDNRCEA